MENDINIDDLKPEEIYHKIQSGEISLQDFIDWHEYIQLCLEHPYGW